MGSTPTALGNSIIGGEYMKDYYKATRGCIDNYNYIMEKIKTGEEPTTDTEDEYL